MSEARIFRSAEFGPDSRLIVDARDPFSVGPVIFTSLCGPHAVEFRLKDDDLCEFVRLLVASADQFQFTVIKDIVERELVRDRE
jgi:hypothetical protein